jgi:AbrB family looped-hinge helix DNA binding protein
MALAQSKLTAQGQISVPVEVRRRLGIGPGSVLEWAEDGDQIVHRSLFAKTPEPKTLAEIKDGVRRDVLRRRASR